MTREIQSTADRQSGRALVFLIVLGAFALRYWGVEFGLPGKYRPDEEYLVSPSIGVLHGHFDPGSFYYPTLHVYVLGLVMFLVKSIGEFFSLFGPEGFLHYLDLHHHSFGHYVARTVSVFWGALGVWAGYQLGKLIYDTRFGILTALLIATSFIHIRDSHFGTTDVPMTTMTTFALFFLVKVARDGRWKDYLAAAVLTGLSMSTKYTAVALGLPFAVAHCAQLVKGRVMPWEKSSALKAGVVAILCFVVFLAGSPFILLDLESFREGMNRVHSFASFGLEGRQDIHGWFWIYCFCLPHALGWGTTVLAASGLVLASVSLFRTWREYSPILVVASFPVVLLLIYVQAKWSPIRYMTLLVPALSVLAVLSLYKLAARIKTPGLRRVTVVVLLLICCGEPALRAIRLDNLLVQKDSRELARTWIESSIPPGAAIGSVTRYVYGKPELREGRHYVLPASAQAPIAPEVEWVLIDEHPIDIFSPPISKERLDHLRSWGEKVYEVSPFRGMEMSGVYDISDAFYAPLSGFGGVERPGTRISIYRATGARHEALPWRGEYYRSQDLSGAPASRWDADVDFSWGMQAPWGELPSDLFSVRWTTCLASPADAELEFLLESDDGSRLYLDGERLGGKWGIHHRNVSRIPVKVRAGRQRLTVEYFEARGAAFVRLRVKWGTQHPTRLPTQHLSRPELRPDGRAACE